jgi:hypothetical protein
MLQKKMRYLFFLLSVFILLFSSCKKELPINETLVSGTGRWYVERVTTYTDEYSYDASIVQLNYRDVGTFQFNSDGTGVYSFVDSVDFTYTINDEGRFYITFDEADIQDERSPIIYYYLPFHGMEITNYTIFSGNPETALFSHPVSGRSSTDVFTKIDFLLTKIE